MVAGNLTQTHKHDGEKPYICTCSCWWRTLHLDLLMLMRNLTHGLSDANEKPYAIKKYGTEIVMKLVDLYNKYFVVFGTFWLLILFVSVSETVLLSSFKNFGLSYLQVFSLNICRIPCVVVGYLVIKWQYDLRFTFYRQFLLSVHMWAASWQNQQNGMCAQRRLRSAWTSAQSDQSLRCPHEEAHWAHSEDPDQTGRMPMLICHRLAHRPFCWFCHVAYYVYCLYAS